MEANSDLETQLNSLLTSGGDLHTALSLIRKRDLSLAATATKERMLQLKRCPVCTLPPPCKHYADSAALPELTDSKITTEQASTAEDALMSKRPDVIRYRSVNGTTLHKDVQDRASSLHSMTKSLRKRMKLLERLDKFKEEKLRKQIEKLESEQRMEEERRAEEHRRERQRLLRHNHVKAVLSTRTSAPQPIPQKSPRVRRQTPMHLREMIAKTVEKALESSLPRVTKVGE